MATQGLRTRCRWSQTSMKEAVKAVEEGTSLREAAKSYNVPVETLRRRVIGAVPIDCRPGPNTIMTEAEELLLYEYVVKMADMGYGLSRDDIARTAFQILQRSKRSHPFQDGLAGRAWLQGFLKRHKLTLRSPQPLSHARARSATDNTVSDFFEKLGGIVARLNLLSKPMQIYNLDETGINVVHKPGKIVAEIGRRKVWSVTSAERGRTHTVLTCVNASGQSLPPMIIYPRKRMKEDLKNGALPGTMFTCSESGWINQSLFLDWFNFFITNIPPARPVLVIEDGHSSHVSLDVIKLARENNIFLLCLPSHCTHILQPLDVGVFKSLKSNFNKECKNFLSAHPGRSIRSEDLAHLLSLAWPQALTPVNIMKGFKQCGIFPLNPGVISDRLLAPSRAFSPASDSRETPEAETSCDLSDILSLPRAQSVHSSTSVRSFNTDSARCITNDSFIQEKEEVEKRKDEEKQKKEEEKKRQEEMKRKKEEEKIRKQEEKRKKEEERKEARRRKEEEKKKKLEEKRRKEDERQRKVEEKRRVQEEKKKKKEEERRKEDERQRKVEEKRRVQEEKKKKDEERLRKVEKKRLEKEGEREKTSDIVAATRKRRHPVQSARKIKQRKIMDNSSSCPVCFGSYNDADVSHTWVGCEGCDRWWHLECLVLDLNELPDRYYCNECL